MVELMRHGDVFVLDIGDGPGTENWLSPERVETIDGALDRVLTTTGPTGLVTTARGKFWSNGLVRESFSEPGYLVAYERLLARFLTLEVPTVAALNGHCYAGGLLFALAHDERIMRVDRGFVCLPEAQIKVPFSPGLAALTRARLAPQVAHVAMTTARRYGGPEALAAGIVDGTASEDQLLEIAVERAAELSTLRGPVLGLIKQAQYAHVEALLGTDNQIMIEAAQKIGVQ